ncbi:DUF1963 domain-containing protein [Streptomyces sp. NPDC097619]|uniref:DUF1963 domain-containing protein n=1 Tax=Streptomyces sp. NPDC097619 TaxID=3157228 RepID=UPI003320CEA4
MARTTPSRPRDVERLFPELVPFRRPAVRLHPRSGTPTVRESSVGGPLLWPREEPWPTCPDHLGTPMVPVLQLFAADALGLVPFPDGLDLLQLLWCPLDHDGCWVRPALFRRASGRVTEVREPPPVPAGAAYGHVPAPCVVHPERVDEYPSWDLPESLWDALEPRFDALEEDSGWSYEYHLATAPGTKLGGYPGWCQDPDWPACPDCREPMEHLLTVESGEADSLSGTIWTPYEDHGVRYSGPGLVLGDAGGVYFFECPTCPGRPGAHRYDCS